jgi:two-component system, NarL family, capsular synthesis sensor histidine kinase RcsC
VRTTPVESTAEDYEINLDDEVPRFPRLAPPLEGLFIEQADRDIAEFALIAGQHDYKRLREWAHRVSGGLAVLGPSMLNEACLELRATLREAGQWTDEVGELAAAVAAELEALRSLAAHRDAV